MSILRHWVADRRWWHWGLIGSGLLGAIGLGLMTPDFSTLSLGLAGIILWALLCFFANRVALFLLGTLVSSCYLFQLDALGQLLLITYVCMSILATATYLGFPKIETNRNTRLVFVIIVWGVFIWASRNLSQVDAGTWSLRYLLTSGVSLLPYAWVALIGLSRSSLRDHRLVLAGIAVGAFAVAIFYLVSLQVWSAESVGPQLRTRMAELAGGLKNSLALLWVIGFSLLLHWKTKRWGGVRLLGLLVFLVAVAYSSGRSAYLALFIVLLVYVRPRLRTRWFYLILVAGIVAFLLPGVVWERITTSWSAERGFEPSAATRLILWRAAIHAFLSSPISGIGLEGFNEHLMRFRYIYIGPSSPGYVYTHNYFLTLFAQTGIVGGFLGLWVFWESYRSSNHLARQGASIGLTVRSCLLAYFVVSLFGEQLFDPVLLVIFLLLLTPLISRETS